MPPTVDTAIIGAGPAGLSAAAAAARTITSQDTHISTSAAAQNRARAGTPRVLVVDSAPQPGGQFWRHRTETAVDDDGRLHHDWGTYRRLRADFDAGVNTGIIDYRGATSVWMVRADTHGFLLSLAPSHGPERSRDPLVRARRLIIATGGFDRQIPIPGWDLPGVMAAGGIQGFAKQNGLLPGSRFLIAGTGPFLLPVAATIAELGGEVAAVVESSAVSNWLPHVRTAAGVPSKALEGAGYAWTFLRHRIPYRSRTVLTEILGEDRVEAAVTVRLDRRGAVIPGSETVIDGIDALGVGWGFTPQLELPVSLGVETRVDVDGSLIAIVDDDQRSTVPGLFLAGEVTGVGGAVLAAAEGQVAGTLAVAETSGVDAVSADIDLQAARATITRHRAFAHAMHLAHPVPAGWTARLPPEAIVCRCEEVAAGEIITARDHLHAGDARAQKNMTRAGMGWCQGRECGFAVTCLSTQGSAAPESGGTPGVHEPAAPLTREGASLAQTMKRPLAQPVTVSTFFDL